MSKGRKNKLTGQVGEHLACAELGLRGYMATPFAGNVPKFDVIIADQNLNTLPVQVKTVCRNGALRSKYNQWMEIETDHKKQLQIYKGTKKVSNPNLVYIVVELRGDESDKHRFYIFTKQDLADVMCTCYRDWMEGLERPWHRPRNYASEDCSPNIRKLEKFENNWKLIEKMMG